MDMEELKKISTSGLSFMRLRAENRFYVDKSMLIADIIETDPSGVFLYTRPRRFGKSTNISMIDAFFNLGYRGNDWFEGLEISEHREFDIYRNAYPVICIDLKDAVANGFDSFTGMLRNIMRNTFTVFRYLLESDSVYADEKEEIQSVLDRNITDLNMIFCIKDLCTMLERHHGRKAIVLIDEYDRAITDTIDSNDQKSMIDYLSSFMSATLKSNPSLQMAYVTGVMQLAKTGMFSGVNNLRVNNILSRMSDERFGFTDEEVKSTLEYYGHPEKIDEVREWYDGYRFGNAEVYNPFSLMNYVSSGFVTEGYWASSGNDRPFRWMMERTGSGSVDALASIISGAPAESDIHMDITYDDMRRSTDSDLHSLMVMTGYLKAVPSADGRFAVSVPNKEVRNMLDRVIKSTVPVDDALFRDFAVAVRDGDSAGIERMLGRLLDGSSYFDLKDESDYKLAVYLCLHGIIWNYDVESEEPEGNGRVDIIMKPKDPSLEPIIMELKMSGSESSLRSDAEDGIRQIHERRYYNGMSGGVMLYGMAFRGVVPKVISEHIVL